MLLLVLLSVLLPFSSQQCLTSKDEVGKIRDNALESLLNSELQFSTDLAHVVNTLQPDQNVFFSPPSIFRALLFTYFLAANDTEANLRKTLHLNAKFDKLDYVGAYYLENYYQKLRSIKRDGCQMNLANRLYVDKSLKVQHCMQVLFRDELQTANFLEHGDTVRRKINHWVASQTNNVIKEFMKEDSLSKNTLLVLLNAAYFKGFWKSEFDEKITESAPFHLSNGTEVNTLMMTQENKFKLRFDETLGAEVVELPYLGDDVSMFILLPQKHQAAALQSMLQKIDSNTLSKMISTMQADENVYDLTVTIPKFTLEGSLELVPILESMGVGDLFQRSADLSRLTGSKGVILTDAVHKAKIKVDEKGTEAAAVTEFISARMGSPHIKADRPFVHIIYDKSVNQVLFFGVFNSPP